MKRRLNKAVSKQHTGFNNRLRQLLWYCVYGLITLIVLVFLSNFLVSNSHTDELYATIDELPKRKVGLLLGTSPYTSDNGTNLFFEHRMEAAWQLYEKGKIKFIVVSGDNAHASYNEPREMLRRLLEHGVPRSKIFLDFAGFRTLDSVVRAKEIFGQQSFTIISQRFQNQRALFIAKQKDIDPIAFNASATPVSYGLKTRVRELFARVKMFYDLYILNAQPRFLGEKITID